VRLRPEPRRPGSAGRPHRSGTTGRPPLAARHGFMPGEPHAFTAPLGLDMIPVTRAHVRLLGPCFKTGRESTRSLSAADWSGHCPRTPGASSLPGSGGVTRATQHPESSPESLPRRVGRSLLARGEVAGLYPPQHKDRRRAAGQPGSEGTFDPRLSGSTPGLCPGP